MIAFKIGVFIAVIRILFISGTHTIIGPKLSHRNFLVAGAYKFHFSERIQTPLEMDCPTLTTKR